MESCLTPRLLLDADMPASAGHLRLAKRATHMLGRDLEGPLLFNRNATPAVLPSTPLVPVTIPGPLNLILAMINHALKRAHALQHEEI
jgi:hypothetical protein